MGSLVWKQWNCTTFSQTLLELKTQPRFCPVNWSLSCPRINLKVLFLFLNWRISNYFQMFSNKLVSLPSSNNLHGRELYPRVESGRLVRRKGLYFMTICQIYRLSFCYLFGLYSEQCKAFSFLPAANHLVIPKKFNTTKIMIYCPRDFVFKC